MSKASEDAATPSALKDLSAKAIQICGDDPHRDGVPAQIVALLQEAFKDPAVREEAIGMLGDVPDLIGSQADPGFGIMGVESKKIGYRGPHDHGPCWAVNVQVRGTLRLVHWARESEDEATGRITIRKLDETLMGAGDVDYSPPGIAHELYPESDDSVELAIRCHSLATVVQHRFDRSTHKYVKWNWGERKEIGGGEFESIGGDRAPPPTSAFSHRLK